MDEVRRTLEAYEGDADAYVAKYRSESVAARYGDRFLAFLEGDRLLDVGCGPGPDLETFATEGYDVTGLDLTPAFLEAAAEHVPEADLARGDMRRLPFRDGSFDGIWSSAAFLHVPRSDAVETLREFRRVLDRDGAVYVSVKREGYEETDANGRFFEYYRPAELRSALEAAALEPTIVETGEMWVSAIAAAT